MGILSLSSELDAFGSARPIRVARLVDVFFFPSKPDKFRSILTGVMAEIVSRTTNSSDVKKVSMEAF